MGVSIAPPAATPSEGENAVTVSATIRELADKEYEYGFVTA